MDMFLSNGKRRMKMGIEKITQVLLDHNDILSKTVQQQQGRIFELEEQIERMYAEDNEKKANLMDAVLELRLWIESCKEKEFLRELKDRGSEINTMEDFLDVVRRSM